MPVNLDSSEIPILLGSKKLSLCYYNALLTCVSSRYSNLLNSSILSNFLY